MIIILFVIKPEEIYIVLEKIIRANWDKIIIYSTKIYLRSIYLWIKMNKLNKLILIMIQILL